MVILSQASYSLIGFLVVCDLDAPSILEASVTHGGEGCLGCGCFVGVRGEEVFDSESSSESTSVEVCIISCEVILGLRLFSGGTSWPLVCAGHGDAGPSMGAQITCEAVPVLLLILIFGSSVQMG